MTARVETLAVLGLGLLGGSVALAAKQRGVAARVVGAARRRATRELALERGVADAATDDVQAAVRGAGIVVLCTPVLRMAEVLRRAAPGLAPGALVTDVGSAKGTLADTLPGLLPRGVAYAGAHPMAGSHRRGVENARADLFEGAVCVLAPAAGTPAPASRRARAFWEALGARVVQRDPAAHDAEVAFTSHAPHALAFAFASALREAPEGAGELAGAGFRDFTRIARSDAEVWSEILIANRKAVEGVLDRVTGALGELRRALEANDLEAVEGILAAARERLGRVSSAARGPRGAADRPIRGRMSGNPGPSGAERSTKQNL